MVGSSDIPGSQKIARSSGLDYSPNIAKGFYLPRPRIKQRAKVDHSVLRQKDPAEVAIDPANAYSIGQPSLTLVKIPTVLSNKLIHDLHPPPPPAPPPFVELLAPPFTAEACLCNDGSGERPEINAGSGKRDRNASASTNNSQHSNVEHVEGVGLLMSNEHAVALQPFHLAPRALCEGGEGHAKFAPRPTVLHKDGRHQLESVNPCVATADGMLWIGASRPTKCCTCSGRHSSRCAARQFNLLYLGAQKSPLKKHGHQLAPDVTRE